MEYDDLESSDKLHDEDADDDDVLYSATRRIHSELESVPRCGIDVFVRDVVLIGLSGKSSARNVPMESGVPVSTSGGSR